MFKWIVGHKKSLLTMTAIIVALCFLVMFPKIVLYSVVGILIALLFGAIFGDLCDHFGE